jgi:hypothetical protein
MRTRILIPPRQVAARVEVGFVPDCAKRPTPRLMRAFSDQPKERNLVMAALGQKEVESGAKETRMFRF